jgi:HEAT repeat protein
VHRKHLPLLTALPLWRSLGLCVAGLVALPVAASPDAAQAKPQPAAQRAAFELYLEKHDVPAADELEKLGPSPAKELIAIASDEHAQGLTRARAVSALRLWPSPVVQSYLENLIQDKATAAAPDDRLLLRRAAIALGWMAGSDAPDLLAALFANEDVEVRVDAVLGISMSRAETAAGTLRKQLVIESSPRVRQQIERQLAALAPPQPEPEKASSNKRKQPTRQPMRGGF